MQIDTQAIPVKLYEGADGKYILGGKVQRGFPYDKSNLTEVVVPHSEVHPGNLFRSIPGIGEQPTLVY